MKHTRSIVSFLILASVLISCLCIPTLAQNYKYDESFTLGDVNGDGKVNAVDLLSLKAHVAGIDGYTVITDAADINTDAKLSSKDAFYEFFQHTFLRKRCNTIQY